MDLPPEWGERPRNPRNPLEPQQMLFQERLGSLFVQIAAPVTLGNQRRIVDGDFTSGAIITLREPATEASNSS